MVDPFISLDAEYQKVVNLDTLVMSHSLRIIFEPTGAKTHFGITFKGRLMVLHPNEALSKFWGQHPE